MKRKSNPAKEYDKCKTCKNYVREESNENWIVCPVLPVSVILSGTSADCEKYEAMEESYESG